MKKDKRKITVREIVDGQKKGLTVSEIYKNAGYSDYKAKAKIWTKDIPELIKKTIPFLKQASLQYNESIDRLTNIIEINQEFIKSRTGITIPASFFKSTKLKRKFLNSESSDFYGKSEVEIKQFLNEYVEDESKENEDIFNRLPFTEREFEVLEMLSERKFQKEIAERFEVTTRTVTRWIDKMSLKVKLNNDADELVQYYLKNK